MKTCVITCIVFLFGILNSHAQLSTEDQKKHFAAGMVISAATYSIIYSKTKNKTKAFLYGIGASTLAGFAKEYLDSKKFDTKLDSSEAFATSLGGLTACVTLNLFVGKRKNKRVSVVPVE